jgi:glutamate-1-semialdehyde 2,1-aminomutase
MAIAVRIARACTRRDKVAICGYHGWHDWYLATNLASNRSLDGHMLSGLDPHGVPRTLLETSLPFHYNHPEELEAIVKSEGDQLAAIVMEPLRSSEPKPGFLEGVRRLADRAGAVLIFDEITVGFRLNCGGAHLLYDVTPDMAIFAKAIGNGYPMAVVLGRESVMQAAQEAFISSTSWTERIGPTAALATIRKYRREDVSKHLIQIGAQVQEVWRSAAAETGLEVRVSGIPPLSHFELGYPNALALRTLFTQMMLERGFLATSSFYATYAHQMSHIQAYEGAVQEVFGKLARALDAGSVESQLKGPVAHAGFQRLT